jgi:RNA polymerase sigma-70 factor (ECF subfamily)
LPDPVRRLSIQPEVASQVLDAERAELRRLMERLADGDRSAFRPAFALLWPRLRVFGLRYAGADGEDAAQHALLRVFSRASEYDRERDALAWALGIAAWECRTFRRKRERRKEDAVAPPQPVDPAPDPEEAAIAGDLRAAALAVLGTLRPIDVETISALAAGARPGGATYRKRLQRALSRFRTAWRARHGSE